MRNPFLQRARDYPLKLSLDIHSFCNGRCTICPYPKYARQQSQGYMDWSLYKRIVQEAGEIGRENNFRPLLSYCYMGEPFLVDDLSGYTSLAERAGMDLSLNTNAAAMTEEKVDALLNSGFSGKIHISFHGISPEVYQRIMGLEYEVSLRHIHYLLERYPHAKICVRGVDDGWPKGEKQRWFDYWRAYGVELEYLRPISRCGSVGRLLPGKLRDPEQIRLYGCRYHHPLVEIVILFDGRSVMCCQDMGREVIWGDVSCDGILGVWNSVKRRKVVEKLYSGEPSGKDFLCSRCEQALGKTGIAHALVEASWRKMTRRRGRGEQPAKSTERAMKVLK